MKQHADLIVYNATIYTVNSAFNIAGAMSVKDGRIAAIGNDKEILAGWESENTIDLHGRFVYPGFIDSHCHLLSYGLSLQQVDLTGTRSYDEVMERIKQYAENREHPTDWITGRGWDQNDWPVQQFPDKSALDSLFPSTPVYLRRIDGHAALANSEALRRANITAHTTTEGGIVEVREGEPTGILIDNAMDLVDKVLPSPTREQNIKALLDAQRDCFRYGLTTVDDAGQDKEAVDLIDSLQQAGLLKIRVYTMLQPTEENMVYFLPAGPVKKLRLHIRSFKFFADGALGSRGACLLDPYSDLPDHSGLLLHDRQYFESHSRLMYEHGFQMNTHCIGDSANRMMLDLYAGVLEKGNDRRWRIEHCQVIHPADFRKFGDHRIIPSVQPTHATSDMYWAGERIGPERIKYAYAYKELLRHAGVIATGSDFPVEAVNPLLGFFAAVARTDTAGYTPGGFGPGNALSREEALRGMTIWAAYANFEEGEKGSLEPGKYADFVLLDKDIMKAQEEEILRTKVISTVIQGEQVYP